MNKAGVLTRRHAKEDLAAGLLGQGMRTLYDSREEYFMEFGFVEFSDKI